MQWPVSELEQLRSSPPVNVFDKRLEAGELHEVTGVTAAQADVEITFEITDISKAEEYRPRWTHAQWLCNTKNASVRGGLGPFGLRVLASSDSQEYTSVFFRVFKKADNKPVVLMCSDQSRSIFNFLHNFIYCMCFEFFFFFIESIFLIFFLITQVFLE